MGLITNTYVLVRQGKKSRKEAWGRKVPQCYRLERYDRRVQLPKTDR